MTVSFQNRGILGMATLCLVVAAADATDFEPRAEPLRLRAHAVAAPIEIDGRLDEADWQRATPAGSFLQIDPSSLAPATQATEVRVLFDDQHLYIGVVCSDDAGQAGIRVQDLRRDFDYFSNDVFGISFDPYLDGRTAQSFQVNPAGAQRDMRVTDGSEIDVDWDAPWDVRTRVSASGWTAEIAIPWSVLRYPAGSTEWGINFVRRVRRIEELSGWSPWPRGFTPYRMTYAGRLEGLLPPPPRRQLRLRPYVLGRSLAIDTPAGDRDEEKIEIGGELRFLPTPSTVIELTANTDFAETDIDRQVVNLSRFSVFFPEKRQFFLENAQLFDSGFDAIKPFFSRRIGLDDFGRQVPIDGGLRVVHQDAKHSAGGLLLRTAETRNNAASTFLLGRYQHNLGARNRLGAMVVARRDESVLPVGTQFEDRDNVVATVDGFFRPNERFTVKGLLSGSSTTGEGGDGLAGSFWAYAEGSLGYAGWVQQFVSPDYEASAGFVSLKDYVLTSPKVVLDLEAPGFLPASVRRVKPNITANFYHSYDGFDLLEGDVRVEPLWLVFQDGSEIYAWWQPSWQRLSEGFSPVPGLLVAAGDYDYNRFGVAMATDKSRKWSIELKHVWGGYFDGRLATTNTTLRLAPSPRLALTIDFERNEIEEIGFEGKSREIWLYRPELRLALDPRKQLTIFYQRNEVAETESYYARLSWELRPLSFVHLVVGDFAPTRPGEGYLQRLDESQRQVILKLGWSFGS